MVWISQSTKLYNVDLENAPSGWFRKGREFPDDVKYHQAIPYHPHSHEKTDCTDEDLTTYVKICDSSVYITLHCKNCRRRLTFQRTPTEERIEQGFLYKGEDYSHEGLWSVVM